MADGHSPTHEDEFLEGNVDLHNALIPDRYDEFDDGNIEVPVADFKPHEYMESISDVNITAPSIGNIESFVPPSDLKMGSPGQMTEGILRKTQEDVGKSAHSDIDRCAGVESTDMSNKEKFTYPCSDPNVEKQTVIKEEEKTLQADDMLGDCRIDLLNLTKADMEEDEQDLIIINCLNTIEVSGFTPDTQDVTVRSFFEDESRSGGGSVSRLLYTAGEAIITFNDLDAVQRILAKKDLILDNAHLTACPLGGYPSGRKKLRTKGVPDKEYTIQDAAQEEFVDDGNAPDMNMTAAKAFEGVVVETGHPIQPQCKTGAIKIRGIKGSTTDDTLNLFFESRRRSGGGEIKHMKREKGATEAVIIYERDLDADNVLRFDPLVLDGSKLTVEPHNPITASATMNEPVQNTVVLVKGLQPQTPTETVEMFFENKRRSGGGDIEKMEHRPDLGTAEITFANHADAERVVQNDNLVLLNSSLSASWWVKDNDGDQVSPETDDTDDDRSIIVTNLSGEMSDDILQCLFEHKRKTGGGPIDVYNRLNESTSRIVFVNPDDAKRVRDRCSVSFDKTTLIVKTEAEYQAEVGNKPVKDTIIVRGFKRQTSAEALCLFFENKRRSGGGQVIETVLSPDNETALVKFDNPEDASNVIQKETLQLDGVPLLVKWHDDKLAEEPAEVPDAVPLSNTILVSGLKPSTAAQQIKKYFKNNKRSGGGPIEDFEHLKEQGKAVITFQTAADARAVLEHGKLNLEGAHLSVTVHVEADRPSPAEPEENESEAIAAIEISGLDKAAQTVNKQFLRLFFESKRSSGGGDIKAMNYSMEDGVAIITYLDHKDCREVLRRATVEPFVLFGATVAVRGLEEEVPAVSCAIEVKGISPNTTEDMLSLYFESRRSSGGEDLESMYFDKEGRRAVITFPNVEAPQRVLQKEPHLLDGCSLNIKMLLPARPAPSNKGPVENHIILVTGIGDRTSAEDMKSFFQQRSNCKVKNVQYGTKGSLALVEFDGVPEYAAIRELVSLKPLSDKMVGVQQVPLADSIQVHNIHGIKEELLSLYFENERRSGGGQIKAFNADKDCALVTFADNAVLKRVLTKRHKLNKVDLNVSAYYDCIGIIPPGHDTSKPPTATSLSIELTDLDQDVLKFILNTQKPTVEQMLSKMECSVQWPTSIDEPLRICRTPRKEAARAILKADEWRKSVESHWEESIVKLYTKINIHTLHQTWHVFLKRTDDIRKCEDGAVEIRLHESTTTVEVWGRQEKVFSLTGRLNKIKTELETDLGNAQKAVTEKVNLKPCQLFMLKTVEFERKEKIHSPNIVIEFTDICVIFKDLPNVISSAKLRMYEIINAIVSETFHNIPESVCRLHGKEVIRSHVVIQLNKSNLQVAWEAGKSCLTVFALKDSELKEGAKVIKEEIIEVRLKIDEGPLIRSSKWKEYLVELRDQYHDTGEIRQEGETLYVASLSKNCDLIIEELKKFINENTIEEHAIHLEGIKYKFVKEMFAEDTKKIITDLKKMQVDIQFKGGEKCLLLVKGNLNGIEIAKKKVNDLINSIIMRDHAINKPGMGKYFVSGRGQRSIDAIENKHCVAIELLTTEKGKKAESPAAASKLSTTTDETLSRAKLRNGTEVFVCKGDLTTYDVGAIVNAANDGLQHIGGLALAIVQKGGRSIQDECDTHRRSVNRVLPGQVYTSGSGNLPCKKVIHAVGPKWQGGNSGEENLIYEAIYECLNETLKHGLDSVAIPALSAGLFGVPLKVSTRNIVSAVKDFCEKEMKAKDLRRVYFVDVNDKTVNHFHESLLAALGDSAIELEHGDRPLTTPTRASSTATSHSNTLYTKMDDKTLVTSSGVRVLLVKGGLEKQKVDVIVNTTSSSIDAKAGVSGAIFKAAGSGLKNETKQFVPLGHDVVAVTSGQNLPCKNIYHVNCKAWDGPSGNCKNNITNIISDTLKTAAQNQLTSIAFPAIGTGNNNVPREMCAELMYKEVAKSQHTPVKEIRFVIYEKDAKTWKAFESEMHKQANPPRPRVGRPTNDKGGITQMITGAEEEEIPSPRGTIVSLGPVRLELVLSDITQERTDGIVNSTDEKIDLTIGGVAKALGKAGGKNFVEECRKAGMRDGIAITSGGLLNARSVIHISAPSDVKNWKRLMLKSLATADKTKMSSVSFPALGTGQRKISGSVMASTMLDAVAEFASSAPACVKLVRIAIFPEQPEILDTFRAEISKKTTDDSKAAWWISFRDIESTPMSQAYSDDLVRQDLLCTQSLGALSSKPKSLPPAPVKKIRICGKSERQVDAALKQIDDVIHDECKDRVLDNPFYQENIKKLDKKQAEHIQGLENRHSVKININKGHKVNRIRIQGCVEDVSCAEENIREIFMEINRKSYPPT